MTTCDHSTRGLCPSCQAAHDDDPVSWAEWGHHPDGERRWAAERERIEREMRAMTYEPNEETPL